MYACQQTKETQSRQINQKIIAELVENTFRKHHGSLSAFEGISKGLSWFTSISYFLLKILLVELYMHCNVLVRQNLKRWQILGIRQNWNENLSF